MKITETITYKDQEFTLEWIPQSKKQDQLNIPTTQCSGYVFNDKNQLLLVQKKNGKWSIPGGKPESSELFHQTFEREVCEESCVKIHGIHEIGRILVIEPNGKKYYQRRFVANISHIDTFSSEMETIQRVFIDIGDVGKYLPYASGVIFEKELITAKNFLKI